MSEVKWIKITTDMFDNRKIKHLRKLPDGNSIVLIWVMLLTLAGRCNAGGMVFLTENIPYTPKLLADELDFSENTVTLALDALQQLGMIQTDGFLTITNWNEYQNVDGMERIREQNRLRKQRQREREQLLLAEEAMSRDTSRDVTQQNKSKNKKENKNKKESTDGSRKRFTPPTLEEVTAYCKERHNNVDPQKFFDYYSEGEWKDGKGNPVRSWKQKVLTWERDNGNPRPKNDPRAAQNYEQRTYSNDLVDLFNDTEDI